MDRNGIVVTGVDGSPGARAALEFALAEAARRGDRADTPSLAGAAPAQR
jgi:hypothetical protein